jgi:hypothetical protein
LKTVQICAIAPKAAVTIRPKTATARTMRHGGVAAPTTWPPPPLYGPSMCGGRFPVPDDGGSELGLDESLPLHAVAHKIAKKERLIN